MKVKLGEIMRARDAIYKLATADNLPIRTGYWVMKLKKACDTELREIEAERRRAVQKYGEEIDGQIAVKPEHRDTFTEEMEKFLGDEVEINAHLISFHDIQEVKISALDLEALAPFISDMDIGEEKQEEKTEGIKCAA